MNPVKMSTKVYDTLKFLVRLVLPGLGTLYFTLSSIWGLPFGKEVVGSISAFTFFLGTCMHVSTSNYEGDGAMVVTEDEDGRKNVSLELHDEAATLSDKQTLTFKVKDKGKA